MAIRYNASVVADSPTRITASHGPDDFFPLLAVIIV